MQSIVHSVACPALTGRQPVNRHDRLRGTPAGSYTGSGTQTMTGSGHLNVTSTGGAQRQA